MHKGSESCGTVGNRHRGCRGDTAECLSRAPRKEGRKGGISAMRRASSCCCCCPSEQMPGVFPQARVPGGGCAAASKGHRAWHSGMSSFTGTGLERIPDVKAKCSGLQAAEWSWSCGCRRDSICKAQCSCASLVPLPCSLRSSLSASAFTRRTWTRWLEVTHEHRSWQMPAWLLTHHSLTPCAAAHIPPTGLVSSRHQHLGPQSPPQPGLGLSPPVLPTASLHCGRAARAASPGLQHKPSSLHLHPPGVVKLQSRESRAGLWWQGRVKGSLLGHQQDPRCSEGQVLPWCVAAALAPVPACSLLPTLLPPWLVWR